MEKLSYQDATYRVKALFLIIGLCDQFGFRSSLKIVNGALAAMLDLPLGEVRVYYLENEYGAFRYHFTSWDGRGRFVVSLFRCYTFDSARRYFLTLMEGYLDDENTYEYLIESIETPDGVEVHSDNDLCIDVDGTVLVNNILRELNNTQCKTTNS